MVIVAFSALLLCLLVLGGVTLQLMSEVHDLRDKVVDVEEAQQLSEEVLWGQVGALEVRVSMIECEEWEDDDPDPDGDGEPIPDEDETVSELPMRPKLVA